MEAVAAEEEDVEAVATRISKLTEELYELFDKSVELEKTVREQLGRIGV